MPQHKHALLASFVVGALGTGCGSDDDIDVAAPAPSMAVIEDDTALREANDADRDVRAREDRIARGRALFFHTWSEGDPRSHGGDGLGPAYNASSCVACHDQGGAGGAGGNHNNVVVGDGRVLHRHGAPPPTLLLGTGIGSGIGNLIAPTVGDFRAALNTFGPPSLAPTSALAGLGIGSSGAAGLGDVVGGGLGIANGIGAPLSTSPRVAKLQIAPPTVEGALDREIVRRVVQRVRGQVSFCYERELTRLPQLQGKLVVRFTITATGASKDAVVVDSTLANKAVEDCVARVVSRLQFPRSDGGGEVHVRYPFVFRADDDAAPRRAPPPPPPPPPPSVIVERNTPALFGIGLIDAIPDEVIEAIASSSIAGHPEISGKAGHTPEGRVTRHGWKGDVPDLVTFVSRACAVELGLETPGAPQPGRRAAGLDIDLDDLEDLLAYVRALPRPVEVRGPIESEGAELFDSVGCTACHRTALGDVDGLYSDLLLHDMGDELDDNASTGYYGSPPVAGSREWRTPPLWGVRDSAPYLHDGRARTLERAIALHGGEAWKVRQAYYALSADERATLVRFLEALQAPR